MAEGTRLLNEHTPKGYRGFESLRLRQFPFSERVRGCPVSFDDTTILLQNNMLSWSEPT